MPSSREPHARKSFRLLALGGAALVESTGVVAAEQRRRLALLILVASGRERGVARDKLIAALSPESPTDSARHALHQLVYYLRQQLGDDAFLGTDPLRLNRDVIGFDVADFDAAIDAGAWEDAVSLYRGPFLDGFHLGDSIEFEEWVAGERSRLAARHADALARLADAANARGDHPAASAWWRRLAAADPLSDRAALGLVRSLAAGGDRSGAVRHARMHESLVRAEIGGELQPELATLLVEMQRVDRRAESREGAAIPFAPEAVSSPALAVRAAPERRRLVAAGLLGAGLMLVMAAVLGGRRPVDRNLLAVAPFDVLDPSLQVWREGVGDMLSRSLDGAGPLRTVSPTTALPQWKGRADRASAEAFGRRTGAGLVVFGTVVPKGRDSVALRAFVLEAGSGSGQREVEVSGESARIGELADSLGFRILQLLGESRAIGSVRQVSMGSRSLPALRAFLQGEQFYRRGSWDSALTRYDQAIAEDSTFALALVRMRAVLIWNPPTVGAYLPAEEYARRATLYNHGLSPRDSLLIVSDSYYFAAPAATEPDAFVDFNFRSLAAIEEAVRRYPGDPEAWYLLGETRLHAPFPIGTPPDQTFEPFSRAIALDSGFAPAYEHMAELAIQLGRPELARRYAAAYLSLYPDARRILHVRMALRALDRSGAADSAGLVDGASVLDVYRAAFEILGFFTDSAETQVRLLRRLGDVQRNVNGGPAWVNDSLMWPQYVAAALAYRGHLREAYQTDRRLLLDPAASRWGPTKDPFLDLALLGAVPDSLASSVFARGLEPTAPWTNELGFTPRPLRGAPWWLAHRDTASLRRLAARAAEVTRRPHQPLVALRARLLGATATAYLALARGDSAGAVAHLEAIPDSLCLTADCFHLHLTLARLLSARGDDRRAGALLERWRWATHAGPWFVLATLERGRVAERLSEREKAIESYRFVTEAWHRADRELQPYVGEARAALARLAGPE